MGPSFKMGKVNINYYKWRPILEGITTLQEMETYWTICDLADANEALDIRDDANIYYQRQANDRRG